MIGTQITSACQQNDVSEQRIDGQQAIMLRNIGGKSVEVIIKNN